MEKITDDLSDSQRSILKQFRSGLEDVLTPDHTDEILIKWLKAKNFNIKDARKIFLQNYYNRIVCGVNTILDTYEKPEVLEKYEACGVLGFAKDGSLIRYAGSGKLDLYGFIMSMSCFEMYRYFSYMMEFDIQAQKKENKRTGRNVNEITYVIDLDGFSIQQVLHKNVIEMGLDATRVIQDCYPEIWRQVLIVNAPIVFDKAFNIFKPVLRSNALEKIKVANKDSSKELLLKYIDEDVLPVFLGGKLVDSNGDPRCQEFIKYGGKVPEKFYSLNCLTLLQPTDPGVLTFTLGPRSVHNVSFVVKEAGSKLRVEVRSENGSITTCLFHKEFGPERNNPVLPAIDEYLDGNDENYQIMTVVLKAQTHCTPENMEAYLPEPGIYVMMFSNVGNWFTSRKVLMRYTIFPPTSSSS